MLPPDARIDATTAPYTIDEIAARAGTRPGAWAIDVYDRHGRPSRGDEGGPARIGGFKEAMGISTDL
ncbi:hypothetical protein ACSNOI_42005 [Actinomadura kijaniata]|uniref:hypothetical protein n=1 Tax=Actinomadura kijaniata TaxID=46161 RepID=UPI003F1C98FA